MSMTVYQIPIDRADFDDVDSFANKVSFAVKLRGSRSWNEAYWRMYAPVATVYTDDLDEAFEIMNLWNAPERVEKHRPTHSLSVGDIVKRGDEFWMVDPFGFTRITVSR